MGGWVVGWLGGWVVGREHKAEHKAEQWSVIPEKRHVATERTGPPHPPHPPHPPRRTGARCPG